MDAHLLTLLCEPETHEALEFHLDAPANVRSGKRYSIRAGIPDFLEMVSGQDKKHQQFYDRFTARGRASLSPMVCTGGSARAVDIAGTGEAGRAADRLRTPPHRLLLNEKPQFPPRPRSSASSPTASRGCLPNRF